MHGELNQAVNDHINIIHGELGRTLRSSSRETFKSLKMAAAVSTGALMDVIDWGLRSELTREGE